MSAENIGRMLGRLWRTLVGRTQRSPSPRLTTPSAAPVRPPPQQPPIATPSDEVESDWRLPPTPPGCQIYEARLQVAGLMHHKDNAIRFVRNPAEHTVVFENDPANSYDRNAIRLSPSPAQLGITSDLSPLASPSASPTHPWLTLFKPGSSVPTSATMTTSTSSSKLSDRKCGRSSTLIRSPFTERQSLRLRPGRLRCDLQLALLAVSCA